MAKQTVKSSLMSKLGSKLATAHEKHKNDETTFGGGGDLPEGIEGGVAQLTDCKFAQYAKGDMKGEYYFYAAGVVIEPKEVVVGGRSLRVEGLRTNIMEPLCDTPQRSRQNVEDHLGWIYNELRKLGVNTSEIGPDDLESVAEALKESKPHFRFRTWKGEASTQFPNPRVNHEWRGVVSDYVADETSDVEDDTTDEPAEEVEPTPAPKTAAKPPSKPATATKAPGKGKPTPPKGKERSDSPPVEEPTDEQSDDLDELAEQADGGDEAAQLKLSELATEAGIDDEDVSSAESFAAVVELIRAAEGGETEEETESEQEWMPAKSDIYLFQPAGSKKPIECEVMAVFPDKQTVNLKSLDDGKGYKSIGWDKLIGDK